MSALKTLSVKLEEIVEDKKIWINPNPTKLKKTMTQPDLLVYSASGLDEPNFLVDVPANKGFVPDVRVQVKVIKLKLGGFMFDEGIAGVKDSAVIFAYSVEEMKRSEE